MNCYIRISFQINASTGLLSSKQPVNYEAYRSVDFDVVATDSGSPSLSSSASVRITITDVNDNRPKFSCINKEDAEYYEAGEDCFYNLEVRCDSLTGYTIMAITARDADSITSKLGNSLPCTAHTVVNFCKFIFIYLISLS